MSRLAVSAVVLCASTLIHAQPPSFEVASVKRNVSGETRTSWRTPTTGTISITNAPLRTLITIAYEMQLFMDRFLLVDATNSPLLRGSMGETSTPHFDVQAKVPEGSQPGQQYAMLRALLAERFKLRAHREMRPVPIYALTVARAGRLGPGLRPSQTDCNEFRRERVKNPAVQEPRSTDGQPLCSDSGIPVRNVITVRSAGSIADLVRRLQSNVDRPLIDETGLSSRFEWNLSFEFTFEPGGLSPSIFSAIQEQLGLKLEPRTAPYEVLVIDAVEMPTEN